MQQKLKVEVESSKKSISNKEEIGSTIKRIFSSASNICDEDFIFVTKTEVLYNNVNIFKNIFYSIYLSVYIFN